MYKGYIYKLLKKEIEHVNMMLECNLRLFSQEILLAQAHKSTCTSTHEMRICTEAQGIPGYLIRLL